MEKKKSMGASGQILMFHRSRAARLAYVNERVTAKIIKILLLRMKYRAKCVDVVFSKFDVGILFRGCIFLNQTSC